MKKNIFSLLNRILSIYLHCEPRRFLLLESIRGSGGGDRIN